MPSQTTSGSSTSSHKLKIKQRWLYEKPYVYFLTWPLSLEFPYFLVSFTSVLILFIIYLLVDGLVTSPDWPVVLLAIVLYVYAWAIWIYQAYVTFTLSFKRVPGWAFEILIFLYITTILQNTAMYAMISRMEPDAFVGIDAGFSNFSRIGLSAFLAIETMAALGTGAIFANNVVPWGFIAIAFNSIQTTLFVAIIAVILISIYLTEYKKKE